MLIGLMVFGAVASGVVVFGAGWRAHGFFQDRAAKRSNTCRPRYDMPNATAAIEKMDREITEAMLKEKSEELADERVVKEKFAADYWRVVAERGFIRAVLKTILVAKTCSRKLLKPEGMEQLFRAEASEISGLLALHAHHLLRTDLSPIVAAASSVNLHDALEKLLKAGRRLGSEDLPEAVYLARCLRPQGLFGSLAKSAPSSQHIEDILVRAVRRDQSKQE